MRTAGERAEEVVVLWKERKDRGEALDIEDLLAQHPDLEDEIRLRLSALALLDRALGEAVRAREGLPDFPDFRILRELGRGGAGVVYEAEQLSMRRVVALKVLYPAITLSPKSVERFRREAQAAGRLHHTNIVPVYGIGEEGGTWFYVMERIRGRTLAEVIGDQRRIGGPSPASPRPESPTTPFSTGGTGQAYHARVALAFAGLAEALEHAHAEGVLHRDLKPSNVLLDEDGTLKITDFGLARLDGEVVPLTMTGDLVGTPAYMSPEQVRRGSAPIDGRADVYSLGATLYEFLTLRPPYRGDSLQAVFEQILTKDPPPPRRWNRRIPRDLETIVVKAMEKNPERRYRSAGDLARDLRAFAETREIKARRVGPLGRSWRAARRSPVRSGLIAAVLMLAGGAAFLLVERQGDQAHRVEAEYDGLLAQADLLMRRSWAPRLLIMDVEPLDASAARARSLLEAAVALAPNRIEAYIELALLPVDPDKRLELLDRARERGLAERPYRLARAMIEQEAVRDIPAREDATLARSLPDGGSWREAWLEGNVLLREGGWKESIGCLTRSLERQRAVGIHRPDTFRLRAIARESDGDLGGALEDYAAYRDETSSSGPHVDVRIASLWRLLGKAELAEAAFSRALTSAAEIGSSTAWVGLCMACANEEQFGWTERATEPALAAHPGDTNLMRIRAGGLLSAGNHTEALRWVDQALRLEPESVKLRCMRGDILFAKGSPKEALVEARLARAMVPTDGPAATLEARCLFADGKQMEAIALLREVVKRHPYDHEACSRLGQLLLEAGQPKDALPVAERALHLHADCPSCRMLHARTLQALGRLDAALRTIDEAIARFPRDAGLHVTRGNILAAQGRSEDALSSYERASALAPDNEPSRINRALLLLGLRRAPEAVVVLTAGAHKPSCTWETLLGNAYLNTGQPKLALAAFDEAIRLDPKSGHPHDQRGFVLLSLGKLPDALLAWQRAAALDPGNIASRNAAAWTLATAADTKLREPARAVALAREALAIDDKPSGTWNTLGVALCREGKWKEAIKALAESAKRSAGGTAFDWLFAAIAYKRLGDDAQAQASFERASTWEAEHAKSLTPDDRAELARFRAEAVEALGIPAPQATALPAGK